MNTENNAELSLALVGANVMPSLSNLERVLQLEDCINEGLRKHEYKNVEESLNQLIKLAGKMCVPDHVVETAAIARQFLDMRQTW